jgi:hypothetical protein
MEQLPLLPGTPVVKMNEAGSQNGTVLAFPSAVKAARNRRMLVEFLLTIASHIERDELETEPYALSLTLTGKTHHEVLFKGYEAKEYFGASQIMSQYVSYPTRLGGNRFSRNNQ